jgi:hypothetical protein
VDGERVQHAKNRGGDRFLRRAGGGCGSAFWEVEASSMGGNGRECGFFGSARLLIGGFADFRDFGAVMVEETSSGVVGERS